MTDFQPLNRRAFLGRFGRGSIGLLVLGAGAAACASDSGETTGAPSPLAGAGELAWRRVNLEFVSAYILVRGAEATIVDTGVPGSEVDIANGLIALGLDWGDVAHVVLTHRHPDHAGSAEAVLAAAPDAAAYAGAADIPAITAGRQLQAVGDGDMVFDLDIYETPGHTAGHISVLDRASGLLVVGDALNGGGEGVIGPNPDFSDDMDTALSSVRKLAELQFDTILFGHGEPVEGGADAMVKALAADL